MLGSTSFSPLKDMRIGKSSRKAVSKTDNMKSTLQRNEDTDEAAHKVEGDETKASKVHGNIDLTDSVKSTAKSQNQQQKSKRKKRNVKGTPLGIQVREKYATIS
eukprot:337557_1